MYIKSAVERLLVNDLSTLLSFDEQLNIVRKHKVNYCKIFLVS